MTRSAALLLLLLAGCATASAPGPDSARGGDPPAAEAPRKRLPPSSGGFDPERIVPLRDDAGEVRFAAPAGFRPAAGGWAVWAGARGSILQ